MSHLYVGVRTVNIAMRECDLAHELVHWVRAMIEQQGRNVLCGVVWNRVCGHDPQALDGRVLARNGSMRLVHLVAQLVAK